MGDALPIHHDQLRACFQLGKGSQRRRNFPKRQQARDVGHARGFPVNHLLHYSQWRRLLRRPRQHDHRRPGNAAVFFETDVDPRDVRHGVDTVVGFQLLGKLGLECDGLLGSQAPIV